MATFPSSEEALLRLDLLRCDISLVESRHDPVARYTATCTDSATGIVLGRRLLPADPHGGPPSVTLGDIVEMIGGAYRLASITVEIEAQALSRRTRRVVDRLRSRDRRWRRGAGTGHRQRPADIARGGRKAVPFESPLELEWLAGLDAFDRDLLSPDPVPTASHVSARRPAP